MANTREIRRRIKSVKNISQITKAMQMVAATKMRRAQAQALASRPYTQTLNQALSRLSFNITPDSHPFFQKNDSSKVGVLLLSTDKSLCGALNTNLFRLALSFFKEHPNCVFYTIGKKGRNFVVKTNKELIADFENLEIVTFREAAQTAKLLIETFLNKDVGEIFLIYPNFISTLRQEATLAKLLPIDPSVILSQSFSHPERSSEGSLTNVSSNKLRDSSASYQNDNTDFLFEPNALDLLNFALNHYIENKIFQSLLETKASEHSARMIAMQNATENAKELVEDLTLDYNQTRQEGITRELLEITSAQAALE